MSAQLVPCTKWLSQIESVCYRDNTSLTEGHAAQSISPCNEVSLYCLTSTVREKKPQQRMHNRTGYLCSFRQRFTLEPSTRCQEERPHEIKIGYQLHRLSDSVREKVYTTRLTDKSLPIKSERRAGKGPAEIGTRSSGRTVMRLRVDRLICCRSYNGLQEGSADEPTIVRDIVKDSSLPTPCAGSKCPLPRLT